MYLIKKPFFSLPSTSTQIQWNTDISFSMLKCRHMVQQNSFVYRFVWRVLCVCLFFLVLYLFVWLLVKHVSVIVTPIKFLNLESLNLESLNLVWGIQRSPVNSPHKGQWCGALIFSLISTIIELSKQSWGWWFETPSCSSIAFTTYLRFRHSLKE